MPKTTFKKSTKVQPTAVAEVAVSKAFPEAERAGGVDRSPQPRKKNVQHLRQEAPDDPALTWQRC